MIVLKQVFCDYSCQNHNNLHIIGKDFRLLIETVLRKNVKDNMQVKIENREESERLKMSKDFVGNMQLFLCEIPIH